MRRVNFIVYEDQIAENGRISVADLPYIEEVFGEGDLLQFLNDNAVYPQNFEVDSWNGVSALSKVLGSILTRYQFNIEVL